MYICPIVTIDSKFNNLETKLSKIGRDTISYYGCLAYASHGHLIVYPEYLIMLKGELSSPDGIWK